MKRLLRQIACAVLAATAAGVPAVADTTMATPSTKPVRVTRGHQYQRKQHSGAAQHEMLRPTSRHHRAMRPVAATAGTSAAHTLLQP